MGIPFVRRDGKVALESPTRFTQAAAGVPPDRDGRLQLPRQSFTACGSRPPKSGTACISDRATIPSTKRTKRFSRKPADVSSRSPEFAAASGWSRIHVLAEVPRIRAERWLNEAWLRDCLKTHLVDRIRTTPSVLNGVRHRSPCRTATTLPTADTPKAVDRLWSARPRSDKPERDTSQAGRGTGLV